MQGDIIRPTAGIRKILEDAHRHFLDSKYTSFIILTQSCDLVQRKEQPCKARYINLAVVRPIDDVLISFLEAECDSVKIGETYIDGLFIAESKNRAKNLLSRIINQNEHGLGLFYLHEDADVGIAEPSVAMLQVSIALRREHYSELVSSRVGRLDPVFQSRLGWIIGNLYSRVATRDWDEKGRKRLTERILASEGSGKAPFWISQTTVSNAQTKNLNVQGMTIEQIIEEIKKHEPQPLKEIAIDRVLKIIKDISPLIPQEEIDKIGNRLANDQNFSSSFKAT
ncbi:MAG: hypothetical protein WAX69_18265 [Victivallales bacterium]